MKRIMLIASLLLLGACNELTYDFSHNSGLKGSDWQDSDVPFKTALFCKENNISFDAYSILYSNGITDIEDIKNISQAYPTVDLIGDSDPNSSYGANFYKVIARGLKNKEFTSSDVASVRQSAVRLNNNFVTDTIGAPLFEKNDNIINSETDLLTAAKEVHAGKSSDSVVNDYAKARRQALRTEEERNRIEEAREEQESRQERQREENDFIQDIKNKFGISAFNQCGRGVAKNLFSFLRADPYAYKGQCVTFDIFPYGPGIKYINSNELLLYGNFLIISDNHIRLGAPLLAVAVEPIEYTTSLGERKIPVTFKIISQP